jgi:2-dehydropantoate 2-reductase
VNAASDPHIGVIGCGSIGSLLAAHLTLAGHRVSVVDSWYPHVERVRADGVEIQAPDETVRARLEARNIDEVHGLTSAFDVLLVAVKSYESAAAVALMAPLLREDTLVVPVQNGMNEEWFARLLRRGRLVGCSVHVPAELTGPGRVTRYLPRTLRTFSLGVTDDGPAAPVEWLAGMFGAAGETEVIDDLVAVKWAKLAVNTMTNAPAAITGWTTNRLWSDPRSLPLVVRAAGETLAVAHAAGVAPAQVFGRIDPALFRDALEEPTAAQEASTAMAAMAQQRTGLSESRPSMLQDVDRGRRSEVRYLNGYVVRKGREYGVPTPVNAALQQIVEEIDRRRLAQDPENLARVEEAAQR